MKDGFLSEKLINLARFELEKYLLNIEKNPQVSHESHWLPLHSKTAPIYRAIHWELDEKKLIYQEKRSRHFEKNEGLLWKIRPFEKNAFVENLCEKYHDYFCLFSNYFEEVSQEIKSDLLDYLKENGLEKEVCDKFEAFTKEYNSPMGNDLAIAEFNKYLLIKSHEVMNKKAIDEKSEISARRSKMNESYIRKQLPKKREKKNKGVKKALIY